MNLDSKKYEDFYTIDEIDYKPIISLGPKFAINKKTLYLKDYEDLTELTEWEYKLKSASIPYMLASYFISDEEGDTIRKYALFANIQSQH